MDGSAELGKGHAESSLPIEDGVGRAAAQRTVHCEDGFVLSDGSRREVGCCSCSMLGVRLRSG